MCCGQITKPKNRQAQAPPVEVQEPNNTVVPVQSNVVLDNINSKRAAQVTREQYHKQRFGRG